VRFQSRTSLHVPFVEHSVSCAFAGSGVFARLDQLREVVFVEDVDRVRDLAPERERSISSRRRPGQAGLPVLH
jgi:hypothetical protein